MIGKGLGEHLRAKADAEHGNLAFEEQPHQLLLVSQPGQHLLLVDLCLGADHDGRVQALGGRRRALVRNPFHELVAGDAGRLSEDARRRVAVMDDG